MKPEEIRELTLEQLNEIFLKMHEPEWRLALEGKSKEINDKATICLLDVEEKRLELQNAQLTDIMNELIENEEELKEGCQQVNDSLGNLQQVEAVLGAVSSFLDVIKSAILP